MPTPVQIGTVAGSYSRTVTASLSTAPSVGNMVFGIGSWGPADDPGPTAVTVSDNQGGVDADYGQESLSSLQRSGVFFVYRLITSTVAGTFEMTVDAGPGSNVRLQIVEMEGEYEFARESSDASGQFDGGSETVSLTTGSANPDGELIAFAALTPRADGSITSVANNPPTGYTTLESRFFDPAPLVSAYKSISASETTTADFGAVVWNGGRLGAKVATYLKLGGGGGGTDYALTCDAGSYSLTGQDAILRRGYTLAADTGSYGLTGIAAALRRGYSLVADAGAYSLTGQDATLRRGYSLTADVGAYALTGQDATLIYTPGGAGYTLSCDSGAYSLTGYDANLIYTPGAANYSLSCDVGVYSLTGQSAVTSLGRRMVADVGAYSLTGQSATPSLGRRLVADVGAYALTGHDATLTATASVNYALACDTGAYSLTGNDATLIPSGVTGDPVAPTYVVGKKPKKKERRLMGGPRWEPHELSELKGLVQTRPFEEVEAERQAQEAISKASRLEEVDAIRAVAGALEVLAKHEVSEAVALDAEILAAQQAQEDAAVMEIIAQLL